VEIITTTNAIPKHLRGGALAIGKFDGMHRGHTLIVSRLRDHAQKRGLPTIAMTFDPLPAQILYPMSVVQPLSTLEQKIELLAAMGLDAMIVCPTDRAFLARSAEDFFDNVIRKTLETQVIVEGRNFCFGHNRIGTPEKLQTWCRETGITCEVIETITHNSEPVSSSRIRTLLGEGSITLANELLSRPYRLTGVVVTGERRGHTLGFPTANLSEVKTIVPKSGLYAATLQHNNRRHAAAVHIGDNPTFGQTPCKIEVFLIDFNDDLYSQTLRVDFLQRLRDVKAFTSVDELVAHMHRDIAEIRSFVGATQ
jgi:riboflavin kinase/FMN adenylyltransferase